MICMRPRKSLTVKRSTVAESKCQSLRTVRAAAAEAVVDARAHAHVGDAAHDRALAPDLAHDPAREVVAVASRALAHARDRECDFVRNMKSGKATIMGQGRTCDEIYTNDEF